MGIDLLYVVLCFCYELFYKIHENKLNINYLVLKKITRLL